MNLFFVWCWYVSKYHMKIEKWRLLINLCCPILALAPHHHTIQVAHTPPSSPILLALESIRSSLLSGPYTYFNLISEQLLSSLHPFSPPQFKVIWKQPSTHYRFTSRHPLHPSTTPSDRAIKSKRRYAYVGLSATASWCLQWQINYG